jgi:hypothetical protein
MTHFTFSIVTCFLSILTRVSMYNVSSVVNTCAYDTPQTVEFLTMMNEGRTIVSDYCDSMDDSWATWLFKPDCMVDLSYVGTDNIIYVKPIKATLRKYFRHKWHEYCKVEDIRCAELYVVLKVVDLINDATSMVLNGGDVWINLETIQFGANYHMYSQFFNDVEFLSDITLRKRQRKVYLEKKKSLD